MSPVSTRLKEPVRLFSQVFAALPREGCGAKGANFPMLVGPPIKNTIETKNNTNITDAVKIFLKRVPLRWGGERGQTESFAPYPNIFWPAQVYVLKESLQFLTPSKNARVRYQASVVNVRLGRLGIPLSELLTVCERGAIMEYKWGNVRRI